MSRTPTGAILRAEAANAVEAVVRGGRSLDTAMAAAEAHVGPDDRGLLRALVFGTLRFHFRLSAQIDHYLSRPLKARDHVIHSLLAVGIFQLSDTRVAHHAAVSLTVEAARLLRRPKMKSLVNAVLRNYLRNPAELPADASDEIRFDHPGWFIETLRTDWPDRWRDVLEANNERAPMWLRANARRHSARDYLARLAGETGDDTIGDIGDIGATVDGFPQAIRLAKPLPVDELPGFAAGDASVQDAAAQLAAPWLLADGGRNILDACAAPGGKTGHLAELAPAGATLTAVDEDPERADRVRETLSRLGAEATVSVGDASQPQDWWDSRPFDRILLDAPCSATGVIRRHPDIKHLRRASDIEALSGLQARLLDACWQTLAPAGRLLYVTCSVLRQENDRVIEAFLGRQADARMNNVLPNNNIHDLMCATTCGYQILPGTRGMDGFYYACLERRA